MRGIVRLAAGLALLAMPSMALAHFGAPGVSAPTAFERAACRMVNQGGVTKRVCDNAPAANANCPMVTKRIVKIGGEGVVRTRRQCS